MSMCRVISCVIGRGCLLWPVRSLGRTLLAFALLHFVLQGQACLLLEISLDFLLWHFSPYNEHDILLLVLVLEGFVGLRLLLSSIKKKKKNHTYFQRGMCLFAFQSEAGMGQLLKLAWIYKLNFCPSKCLRKEFPGFPVVRTPASTAKGPHLIPGRGRKGPEDTWPREKKKFKGSYSKTGI